VPHALQSPAVSRNLIGERKPSCLTLEIGLSLVPEHPELLIHFTETVGSPSVRSIGKDSLCCARDLPILETKAKRFLGRSGPVRNTEFSQNRGHVMIDGLG
jgi:hypothetical protein